VNTPDAPPVDRASGVFTANTFDDAMAIPNTIQIQVNGEPQTCAPNLSLPQLLTSIDLNPRLVAVEYNGEILHRQHWETTQLQEGDRLEIVTIVGGGR